MRMRATKPTCHVLAAALAVVLLPYAFDAPSAHLGAQALAQESAKKKPRRIPHLTEATYRRLSEAEEFIEADQFAELIDMLEPLLERSRRYNGNELAQMHNLLAFAYYEQDDIAKTIHHYEQVLAKMPDISEGMELTTLNQLSKLYFQEGNKREGDAASAWYRKSLNTWEEWLSKAENPGPDAHFYTAQIYYQMRDFPRAISSLELVVALSRERGIKVREQWWQMLQFLYFDQENWPKVIEVLEILVKDYPKRVYWVNLASVYGEAGWPEKQMWTMEAAHVAGYLTQEGDLKTYGGLLLQSEIPNRASKYLQQGIDDEILDKTVRNLQTLGQAYQLAQDVDKAIPVFEDAAELAEDGETYDRLSMLYLDKDQHAECEKAAKNALDKGGLRNTLGTRITLATCQFNLDKLIAARNTFVEVRREARREEQKTEERIAQQWIGYIENERKRRAELERAGG